MKITSVRPDLPALEEIQEELREILDSGKITNFGKYVQTFEEESGRYLDTLTATVSSGTMGLLFVLQALGIKPGDKVILPSFTFMATAQAILYAGGTPLFAEIDRDMTLSVSDLEDLLTRHGDVRAVLPIHTYGLPCKTEEIEDVVRRISRKNSREISIVYDAAHAFGAAIGKKRVGSFGDAEVFSLSATKALVSVEGGLISTRNPELIDRVRRMRNYGIQENYNAHWQGLNGKMSEFHAVIGLFNLRKLDHYLEKRKKMAQYYRNQISLHTSFEIQSIRENMVHTFKDFTLLMPADHIGKRAQVMAFLKERGIETKAYFDPPVHEQVFFKQFADRPLPRTEEISKKVITVPFYTLISQEEIDFVVESLVEIDRSLR